MTAVDFSQYRRRTIALIVTSCAFVLIAVGGCGHEPAGWPHYGGSYENARYSPLSQIGTYNVARLAPAYVAQTGVLGSFEATPVVTNGKMFISTPSDGVMAIDAATGSVTWRRPPISGHFRVCCGAVNRGVALADGLVILGQVDGVLVALDQNTGKIRWATQAGDNRDGYSITMAPLVHDNVAYVGVAGSEYGVRASMSAYAVSDGTLRWRWYATDPKTWFGRRSALRTDSGQLDEHQSMLARRRFANSWKRGGGGMWSTPAFDETSKTLYFTTGNPWPVEDGSQRPGDNLYTDSIVALDAQTGRLKWYFQQVPHDTDDLDAASPPVLFTTVDNAGHRVGAVGEVGKNGVFYILNRKDGSLIRRVTDVASSVEKTKSRFEGGSSWSPVSYDPTKHLVIISAEQHVKHDESAARHGSLKDMEIADWRSGYGLVEAIDVDNGQLVWQDVFDLGVVGGATSTAGGITFVGEGDGNFDALETASGRRLWHFQTGAGVNAAPAVFEVHGNEYVAVAAGGNEQLGTTAGDALFVFSLH